MLTERDIFFSDHPKVLLSSYTSDQLESALGYSNIDDLIDHLYNEYTHITLVIWDPRNEQAFFDYKSQSLISLDRLNNNFDKYSPMSLQKLQLQLKPALQRWMKQPNDTTLLFQQLYQRISNRIVFILTTDAIIE